MKKIAKNLQYLRKQRGLSQEDHGRGSWELRDRGSVHMRKIGLIHPIDMLIKLSTYFELPIDVLVKNDLSLSREKSFIDVGQHRVLFPIIVDDNNEDIIEVVPLKHQRDISTVMPIPNTSSNWDKSNCQFIPTGKHRAFPIKGDSMLPLKEGSWVIGKFIEDINEVRNGRTYVLLTKDDGIVYKRVYRECERGAT